MSHLDFLCMEQFYHDRSDVGVYGKNSACNALFRVKIEEN